MGMKCFKVVQKVLEDTYGEIPGNERTRDEAIKGAIGRISSKYGNLLNGGGPDFKDPVNRFAYVYSYVPAHAHWVNELLEQSNEAAAVFDSNKVRIACIGGGPGSDLVGILKFLDERAGVPPAIFCEIVDGCEEWKLTWADIGFTLDLPASLNTDYVIHRVGDPGVWMHPTKFSKADLFTLNFFVSEIAHLGDPAWDYVEKVLEKAKTGAVLLFNDNNDSRFFGKFDAIAARGGWEALVTNSGDRKVYDPGEKLDDLGRFRKKFGRASKLTGNVAWRVLRKTVDPSTSGPA
jgi:hypothetical protein